MKTWMKTCASMLLILGLAACGAEGAAQSSISSAPEPTVETVTAAPVTPETTTFAEATEPEVSASAAETDTPAAEGGKTLIAYFTVPEDADTSGVDAIAGASIVMKDGEVLGNTEYVAQIIRDTVGGDLFRIETVDTYPLDHEPLVDQAADEQDENARPALKTQIEDPGQYDTIILGYPNWWSDMPQPLYTFLETYDFSGKTIIPFVTHGGSGFSGTQATIAALQPGAVVSDNALSLSRNDVAEAETEIRQWAGSLGLPAASNP